MPKVTHTRMIGQINGEGGHEVEVTYDVPVVAAFAPYPDITLLELAQALEKTLNAMGIGRVFTDKEWEELGTGQRHWRLANA